MDSEVVKRFDGLLFVCFNIKIYIYCPSFPWEQGELLQWRAKYRDDLFSDLLDMTLEEN